VFLNVIASDGAPDAELSFGGSAMSAGRRVSSFSAAPPFLLVHGLSSNARLWGGVAAALSRAGHSSFAVDLRSHGESDAPDEGYDTATAAADLAAVIKELSLDRPIVAGQSWGGNVVVRLAARHPELIGGIGLVDGGWIELSSSFSSWAACEKVLRPSNMDGVTAATLRGWIISAHPDWSEQAVEATLANFRVRPDGTLERRLAIPRHLRILRSMWDDPPGPDLPQVAARALLLPAAGPDDAKAERVAAAAAVMRSATILWHPKGDHDLHAQQPEVIASELLGLVT
jgi:pimeloyl-ACP methyl ester carboxylesterase